MQQYCEIATPKGVMRGFFHVPHRKEFPVLLIFHGFTDNVQELSSLMFLYHVY